MAEEKTSRGHWPILARDFTAERINATLKSSTEVAIDPLAPKEEVDDAKSAIPDSSTAIIADPLSSIQDPLSIQFDPLTAPRFANARPSATPLANSRLVTANRRKEETAWLTKRSQILREYRSELQLDVSSSLAEESIETEASRAREQLARVEREQIDAKDRVRERTQSTQRMSQKELILHLDKMARDLELYWDRGEMVAALHIVNTTCQIVLVPSQPQIFPYIAALAHKFLDFFGTLVFQRLMRLAVAPDWQPGKGKPEPRLPEDVPVSVSTTALEKCRNWIFKVACIGELGPRLYVSFALLRCFGFLDPTGDTAARNAEVFARQIRGVGNPLVAAYLRMYLVHRVALLGNPQLTASIARILFLDWVVTQNQWREQGYGFGSISREAKISRDAYGELHRPPLEWMLHHMGSVLDGRTAEAAMLEVYGIWKEKITTRSALCAIIQGMPASVVSPRAAEMITFAQGLQTSLTPLISVLIALGPKLAEVSPPEPKVRLREMWAEVQTLKPEELPLHVEACAALLPFVVKCVGQRQVGVVLSELRDRLAQIPADEVSTDTGVALATMLRSLAECDVPVTSLLAVDGFLPLVDHVPVEDRAPTAEKLMQRLLDGTPSISDPVVIHSALELCRTMHDSLLALPTDDHRRTFSRRVTEFVEKVTFPSTLQGADKGFTFFGEARRAFPRVPEIATATVAGVLKLIQLVAQSSDMRNHTRKPAMFAKACLAFAHITIPSMTSLPARVRWFTLTGQVALQHHFLPQTDILFRSAISTLASIPAFEQVGPRNVVGHDETVVELVQTLSSALLVAPGHPEHGPLYLYDALLTCINEREWDVRSGEAAAAISQVEALLAVLAGVSTIAQKQLPFHAPEPVRSNDTLYALSSKYAALCASTAGEILAAIERALAKAEPVKGGASLPPPTQRRLQKVALEALELALSFADVSSDDTLRTSVLGWAHVVATGGRRPLEQLVTERKKQANSTGLRTVLQEIAAVR